MKKKKAPRSIGLSFSNRWKIWMWISAQMNWTQKKNMKKINIHKRTRRRVPFFVWRTVPIYLQLSASNYVNINIDSKSTVRATFVSSEFLKQIIISLPTFGSVNNEQVHRENSSGLILYCLRSVRKNTRDRKEKGKFGSSCTVHTWQVDDVNWNVTNP